MGKKGGKKGGGKKGKGGGKKGGGSAGKTAAVGSILQPPSSFSSWKEGIPQPVVLRTAPSLMPHRQPPALQTKVPIDIVRAALVGNALAVSAWMTRGGSIDATWDKPDGSARGFTMLMLACMRGLVPMTEWLIKRGAGIDLRNSAGATALILASGDLVHGAHGVQDLEREVALAVEQPGGGADQVSRPGGAPHAL